MYLEFCVIAALANCIKTTGTNTIKNSTTSGVAEIGVSDGQPIQLRSQIDVPLANKAELQNTTQAHKLFKNRRTILIINHHQALRHGRQKKKRGPEKAEKLLYEERNPDGSVAFTYEMTNLDDVALFFRSYLNAEICHSAC